MSETEISEHDQKYPSLCLKCGKRFSVIDGERFACGMMVEAMDAGDRAGGCAHMKVLA